jgi:hypothetical protein
MPEKVSQPMSETVYRPKEHKHVRCLQGNMLRHLEQILKRSAVRSAVHRLESETAELAQVITSNLWSRCNEQPPPDQKILESIYDLDHNGITNL